MLGDERNGITGGTAMKQYVGLDVSMEETKIHVLDEEGRRIWRGAAAIRTTLRPRFASTRRQR
jgi:hypothetical protein